MHGTGDKEHLLLYTLSNDFKGVSLVFEYAWFLFQQTKNADNNLAVIDLATKAYQTSGTQSTVLNALQPAIEEHCHNPDILTNVIIGITHKHRMCKWFIIQAKI